VKTRRPVLCHPLFFVCLLSIKALQDFVRVITLSLEGRGCLATERLTTFAKELIGDKGALHGHPPLNPLPSREGT